ncbi:MAG: hypothetical protein ACREDR_16750 [Blastocatellia bacterium]
MPNAVLPASQNIASSQADARAAYYNETGLQEHERRLFVCTAPPGTDTTDLAEFVPIVTEILPTPRITNSPLDTVGYKEGAGYEAVRVQKFRIDGISRQYIDTNDLRPLATTSYWLVLSPVDLPLDVNGHPTNPSPSDAQAKKYPRFKPLGTPEWFQNGYRMDMVETK